MNQDLHFAPGEHRRFPFTDAEVPPTWALKVEPFVERPVFADGRSQPARADCDHDPKNFCEVDLTSSKQHCGACGHTCPGAEACVGGLCVETPNPPP
jgi:Stigma-specific protein, Stig1